MLLCHFSFSLSYSHSLSIHLTLPSHLLHHLCSCNKQDSACARFHSVAFFPLLILAQPPLQAWPPLPGCLTDLFVSHDGATMPSQSPICKNVSDAFVTHCVLPLCSKPSRLTQRCFHRSVKACWRHRCGNLTRALSMAYTWLVITLNYPDKTKPSLPRSEECTALGHTVDLSQSSYWHPTQLDNGKISVKYCVWFFWLMVQTQQSRLWRQSM